ncbi:MAG: hypothetical protein ACP6KW_11365 [Candidatus Thorarchaeota archaeon]
MNETSEGTRRVVYGIVADYHWHDTRWFAYFGFAPIIIGAIGMVSSGASYLGWTLDIGTILGLGPIVLSESVLMIPVYFVVSMLFFAGGVEWWVLCRHCPCYEYSGARHGNEKKFYCLGNWGSPKLYKYAPGRISRLGQAVFVLWVAFYLFFPILYMLDRWELAVIQVITAVSFVVTLRHWACSHCPNFGCILNCVSAEDKEAFIEAMESGLVYPNRHESP